MKSRNSGICLQLQLSPQLHGSHRTCFKYEFYIWKCIFCAKFILILSMTCSAFITTMYCWITVLFHHKCHVDAVENMFRVSGRHTIEVKFFYYGPLMQMVLIWILFYTNKLCTKHKSSLNSCGVTQLFVNSIETVQFAPLQGITIIYY